ncbi:MAG: type II toxin-antitoxin system HipA family toxin [Labilithrix sp.]|nr:type II toxin-antitoxin system HipA family toxin [Labilithrix sp.]
MSARVFLDKTLVGQLAPNVATQTTRFEFDASYAVEGSRPVLGRWFEDHDISPPRRFDGSPLPNYFRNLLPEGALRKVVAARLGPSSLPEYSMLLRLGGDLPGAVRVESDELDEGPLDEQERHARAPHDPFRFALTGVQPKLSLYEVADRLTVPVEGEHGFWIAKFGTPAYRELVQNEHTMLRWAARCGLNVPEHRVVRARDIDRLPEHFDSDQPVLLVRRFDREGAGRRIHQEDFAQVFDIAPDDKYVSEHLELDWVHYGSIGAVVFQLCGFDDFVEYMKRLAFTVLSGNGDAHVKNWALVYPDTLRARLAPVYDFVATVAYGDRPTSPAMRWVQPEAPTMDPGSALVDVTLDDLLAAASYAEGADTARVMDELERFIGVARGEWAVIEPEAPPFTKKVVAAHLVATKLR